MTMREVARNAKTSLSSLTRIEAGQVSPNVNTIERLANALGVEPAELLAVSGREATSPGNAVRDRKEEQLLAAFRGLDLDQRRLVLAMSEELARLTHLSLNREEPVAAAAPAPATGDSRHYVQGWDRATVSDSSAGGNRKLTHTAGGQFSKPFEPIRPGDVMWIVFVDAGELKLVGRLVVAARRDFASDVRARRDSDEVLFTQREVERILKSRDVWPAPEHLLSKRGEPLRANLAVPRDLVSKLTFSTSAGISEVARTATGGVAGQAFRSVRLLTPESGELLERLWAQA